MASIPTTAPALADEQDAAMNNVVININIGVINNGVVNPQILDETPVSSPTPGLLQDLVRGLLKVSSENSVMLAKLTESMVNEARLRQELETLRNSTAIAKQSAAVDNFTTFLRFQELPTEIRLQIWRFAAQHPRVMEVRREKFQRTCNFPINDEDEEGEWDTREESDWEFRVHNNVPPAILHANSESRAEAIQFYKLGSLNGEQFPTYFNNDVDILYLTFHTAYERDRWDEEWAEPLKAATSGGWSWNGYNFKRVAVRLQGFRWYIQETVEDFRSLRTKEIILVDETPAQDPLRKKDSYPALNLSRNIDLIKLGPRDLLKRFVTYGTSYTPKESSNDLVPSSCAPHGIHSVEEFLTDCYRQCQDRVDKMNSWGSWREDPEDWEDASDEDGDIEDEKDENGQAGDEGGEANGGQQDEDENGQDGDEGGEANDGQQDEDVQIDEYARKPQHKKYKPTFTVMRLKFSNGDETKHAKRKITLL